MFSTAHLIWIGISAVLIVGGLLACRILRPSLEKVLRSCFVMGVASEVVKIFSVSRVLPMVTPAISGGELTYTVSGQYTPYLEMADLPLEMCSLMIAFLALSLFLKNTRQRSILFSLMYITGLIGGLMGIFLAYITADFHTVGEYFASPRVWQYFLYHAMVVFLGIYLGLREDSDVSLRRFKSTVGLILLLDLPTFFLNSVFSQAAYVEGKPVGVLYRTNFFSSYVNPLGLVLTEKWQWIAYLCVRLALAMALITLMLSLAPLLRRALWKKKTAAK